VVSSVVVNFLKNIHEDDVLKYKFPWENAILNSINNSCDKVKRQKQILGKGNLFAPETDGKGMNDIEKR
jgi:hypothetical protein